MATFRRWGSGNVWGAKCRPRVLRNTLGERKWSKVLPKSAWSFKCYRISSMSTATLSGGGLIDGFHFQFGTRTISGLDCGSLFVPTIRDSSYLSVLWGRVFRKASGPVVWESALPRPVTRGGSREWRAWKSCLKKWYLRGYNRRNFCFLSIVYVSFYYHSFGMPNLRSCSGRDRGAF